MGAAAHALVSMHFKSYATMTHRIQDAIIEEKVSINQKIATEGVDELEEGELEGKGGSGRMKQWELRTINQISQVPQEGNH